MKNPVGIDLFLLILWSVLILLLHGCKGDFFSADDLLKSRVTCCQPVLELYLQGFSKQIMLVGYEVGLALKDLVSVELRAVFQTISVGALLGSCTCCQDFFFVLVNLIDAFEDCFFRLRDVGALVRSVIYSADVLF